MIDEPRYSLWTVITFACWIATGVVLFAAWVIWVGLGQPTLAILTAETACVLSAIAAVLQLRCYGARLARLIRVTNGLQSPDDAAVRQLSPRD